MSNDRWSRKDSRTNLPAYTSHYITEQHTIIHYMAEK